MKKDEKNMKENIAYKLKSYTYSDLQEIDDDNRYEIINGDLYLMSAPTVVHQALANEINIQLSLFLREKKCKVFISPIDVVLSKSKDEKKMNNVVQPDVIVVCEQEKIEKKRIFGAPTLIVEVLSENNRRHDKFTKYRLYQKYGVKEYWIVDPVEGTITQNLLDESGEYNYSKIYELKEKIPVKTLKGCTICLEQFYKNNKNLFPNI